MKRCLGLLLAWGWLAATGAHAQDVVIYRCTDAQGALAVQNMPCPKGTQQQKKIMQAPAPVTRPMPTPTTAPPSTPLTAAPTAPPAPVPGPAPTVAPEPPTGVVARVAQAVEPAAPRGPPAPLYDCHRRDQTRYFSEDLQRATYCVPMQVTGLDGNPRTGAGDACEVVHDRCEPVAEAGLCDAWRELVAEAENHWRFATQAHASQRQAEYARMRDLLAASRCGDGAANSDQKP
ncbi:MAG TPA: DUF4124 domain-containing protein [Stenotrophomonas sp.]|jgi:hypothetical protein